MSECADQAFAELVYIVIDSGAPQRKTDVIGCRREAEARIRQLFPQAQQRNRGSVSDRPTRLTGE